MSFFLVIMLGSLYLHSLIFTIMFLLYLLSLSMTFNEIYIYDIGDAVTEGSLPPSPHKDRDPTPLGGSSPPSSSSSASSSSASSSLPLPSSTSNTASSSSSSHASGATTSATASPAAVVPTYSPQLKALLSVPNDTDTNFLGGFVSVRRIKGTHPHTQTHTHTHTHVYIQTHTHTHRQALLFFNQYILAHHTHTYESRSSSALYRTVLLYT